MGWLPESVVQLIVLGSEITDEDAIHSWPQQVGRVSGFEPVLRRLQT
jgi:hypothetical protein